MTFSTTNATSDYINARCTEGTLSPLFKVLHLMPEQSVTYFGASALSKNGKCHTCQKSQRVAILDAHATTSDTDGSVVTLTLRNKKPSGDMQQ